MCFVVAIEVRHLTLFEACRNGTVPESDLPPRPEVALRSYVRCLYHGTACPRGLIGAQNSDKLQERAFYLGNVGLMLEGKL